MRARPGAPVVPEMLSICRTEPHCAGDRSRNTGQSANLTGGNPGGWARPGVVQIGRARAGAWARLLRTEAKRSSADRHH
jgi:hypothetical protein